MEGNHEFLQKYALAGGVDAVSGWLGGGAVSAVLAINDWQKWHGIKGNVAEIGVHHGKFFALLKNTCEEDEFAIAVDVFEDQHLNSDHSGMGDRTIFKSNLQKYTNNKNIRILQKDSIFLTPHDFKCKDWPDKIRIFSVDGSHTSQHTLSDLNIATNMLTPGGVVVLDDFYNPAWPGVQEGFYRFIIEHGSEFSAVAYGDNKIIISRHDDHERLLSLFKKELGVWISIHKEVTINEMQVVFCAMRPPPDIFTEDLQLRRNCLPESNIRFRLGAGWSIAEPLGVWSDADVAEVELDLDGAPRLVTLGLHPFLHSGRPTRGIVVALGNDIVAESELTGPEAVTVEIPYCPSGRATLSIRIDHPDRPADFGGPDVRSLGVFLSSIKKSS